MTGAVGEVHLTPETMKLRGFHRAGLSLVLASEHVVVPIRIAAEASIVLTVVAEPDRAARSRKADLVATKAACLVAQEQTLKVPTTRCGRNRLGCAPDLLPGCIRRHVRCRTLRHSAALKTSHRFLLR